MARATVLALWSQVLPSLDIDASLRLPLSVISFPFRVYQLRQGFSMGVPMIPRALLSQDGHSRE